MLHHPPSERRRQTVADLSCTAPRSPARCWASQALPPLPQIKINFEPDKTISATEFAALIRTIKERAVMSPGKAEFIRVSVQLPPAPAGQLTRALAVNYLELSLAK